MLDVWSHLCAPSDRVVPVYCCVVLCVFSAVSSEQKMSVVSHAIGTVFCDTTAMQYVEIKLTPHSIPEKIKLTFCAIFRVCRSKLFLFREEEEQVQTYFLFSFSFS
jgi:hypothetical protein